MKIKKLPYSLYEKIGTTYEKELNRADFNEKWANSDIKDMLEHYTNKKDDSPEYYNIWAVLSDIYCFHSTDREGNPLF